MSELEKQLYAILNKIYERWCKSTTEVNFEITLPCPTRIHEIEYIEWIDEWKENKRFPIEITGKAIVAKGKGSIFFVLLYNYHAEDKKLKYRELRNENK